MNSSEQLSKVEIVNCNHGGFYSVNDWSRVEHMLGQVQKLSPTCWAAREHGKYRDATPPHFKTRREAVDYLVNLASIR